MSLVRSPSAHTQPATEKPVVSGHTPGPWTWCDCRSNCGHIGSASDHLATVTIGEWGDEYAALRHIGTSSLDQRWEPYIHREVYGEVALETAKANARLIATAPEMFEALANLYHRTIVGTDEQRHAALDEAWRVLVKARTAVEGPSVGTQGEARSEPKTPANGDSQ